MLRRVEPKFAGPSAMGVLVPMGANTIVVVRPRALAWDLLPARWDGDASVPPRFCSFSRDQAAKMARRFIADLEAARKSNRDPVETFGNVESGELQIWVRLEEVVWIACNRQAGQAYKPATFATSADAIQAAMQIRQIVHPALDEEQEYYFNTQSFA